MLALPILLIALSLPVFALNDWNVPCTDGRCAYDWVGDGSEKAFSSLAIDGSRQLLSDVTQAAGWKIMDCNPDWKEGPHDIRLVCDGTPEQVAHCGHVFDNGPEDTVVRLPQSCGVGPFARVRKVWTPSNQTLPDNVKRELVGRATEVRAMTLDYDFKDIPDSRGKLNFAITSTNKVNPVVNRRRNDHRGRGRDRYLYRRGLFDSIKDAASAVTDAAKTAATSVADGASAAASVASSVATEATSAVTSVATEAATAVTDAGKAAATAASGVADKAADATSFNKTETGQDVPLKFDKNFTIIDTDISCVNFKNDINAHVHLDVDAHMDAKINYGYTLVGSLVPFRLDDMGVFADMSGTANMTFGLALEATGQLDTFPVEMFKIGMPGLSIPGVATLGPELKLEYRLTMDLDIAAQMDINANFDFGNVNMVFPENKGNSTATSKPVQSDNTVQVSTANTGSDFSGTIEAVLIPSINFGVDLNVVSAAVFLEMEIGAEMEMIGTSGIGGPPAVEADAEGDESTEDDVAAEDGTAEDTATDDGAAVDATADDSLAEDPTVADDSTEADPAAVDDSTVPEDSVDADSPTVEARANSAAEEPSQVDDGTVVDAETLPEDTVEESDLAAATDEVPEGDSTADEETLPEDDATAAEDDTATEDDTAAEDDTATEGEEAPTDDATTEDNTAVEEAPPEPQPLTGCVRVNGVMEMNYGLRGTLVPLFPQSLKFPLLSTKKELFTKCFGDATPDLLDQLAEEATDLEATAGEVGVADGSEASGDATSEEDAAAAEGDAAAVEDDAAATEDPAATDEDPAAADEDPAAADEDPATVDTAVADPADSDPVADAASTRRKRHALSIRQRRRLASLKRRDFLGDLEGAVTAAAPTLAGAALNVLLCPSGFIPLGAFGALPI